MQELAVDTCFFLLLVHVKVANPPRERVLKEAFAEVETDFPKRVARAPHLSCCLVPMCVCV